jgi:Protein of unknown function (DUF3047)
MTLINSLKLKLCSLAIAFALISPANLLAEGISLEDKNLTHISFKQITPNHFDFKDDVITIQVDKSASFLLYPFKNKKDIKTVSFQWKKQGTIDVKDASYEETRQGDDAYLRIGLVIEGEDSFNNPFAPKWVKTVRETLHHSSDKMIYIISGSKHEHGQRWKSPYSDEVEIISVGSRTQSDHWNISEYIFKNSQTIVGLWIMADGDNTQSTFTSKIKALTLN